MELQEMSTNNAVLEMSDTSVPELKVYKKRWYVLGIFCLTSVAIAMQVAIYSLSDYHIVEYVGLPRGSLVLDLSFIALFLTISIPGGYILYSLNLRKCLTVGVSATCLGAWLQWLFTNPLMGWMLLATRSLLLCLQVLFYAIPLKISAVWFPSNQVCTSAAIGVSTAQLSSLISTLILQRMELLNWVNDYFNTISHTTAAISTILFILVIIYFPSDPSIPPSCSQWKIIKERRQVGYIKSLRTILSDPAILLLLISTSIIIGVMFPISYNYYQFLLMANVENERYHEYVILADTASGLIGILAVGIILDKLHIFEYLKVLCILISIAVVVLMEVIPYNFYASYVASVWLGFGVGALYSTAIQLGIEISYPENPSTSALLLNGLCLISGSIVAYAYIFFYSFIGTVPARLILYLLLLVSNILLFPFSYKLRRLNAESSRLLKKVSETAAQE